MNKVARTIRLGGQLGKRFGKTHRLVVEDTCEALRALCVTVEGFEKYMMGAHRQGIHFAFSTVIKISGLKSSQPRKVMP